MKIKKNLKNVLFQCFNNNINGIKTIYATTHKNYNLTDKVKENLRLNI